MFRVTQTKYYLPNKNRQRNKNINTKTNASTITNIHWTSKRRNTSDNLLKESRQIVHSLYQVKQITK